MSETEIPFTYAHAAIMVSDIERSATWYERAMGWKREFAASYDGALGESNGYGGPGKILMGKLGGVPLEFVQMDVKLERKTRSPQYGIFMCSVHVPDLAPVRERLAKYDIPITREVDIATIKLLVLTDPDGQEVGIIGMPKRK